MSMILWNDEQLVPRAENVTTTCVTRKAKYSFAELALVSVKIKWTAIQIDH